jgi:hypothetical protein
MKVKDPFFFRKRGLLPFKCGIGGFFWLFMALPARAQTFSEWFKQNSTRLRYYASQIAALQTYLGEMERGYQVSNAGLATISGSKQGEFGLHQDYYASLGDINPVLGKLGEAAEIGVLQAAIIERFSNALTRYRNDGLLGAERLTYLGEVYSTVLQAGLADVATLTDVLTANHWQMTDDQRMGRIRELDAAMLDRYSFTLAFTDRADLLERQQVAEDTDIKAVMGLYGVP